MGVRPEHPALPSPFLAHLTNSPTSLPGSHSAFQCGGGCRGMCGEVKGEGKGKGSRVLII
ncbi:hypothetical protein E2C01_063762 [Portunus trituberculatus]|uniref:Uncharacterized protein n=1 Tax=Portunus trituberculatus TaxID=210409 RepID=A0A5B7HJ17_PORTR|nr:hypothetical protein [Portunus trituberculatus]